ncbi:MAG: hypothetical protein IIA02_15610 [Proteobacteria bacterium]|uniref:hypothetical protein n=1 Tax=Aquabacterium sp. TaxID=1872578 RepID=UPI0035C72CA2|nr:hypothetical protein [Pseudomonadota bacterium]
MIELVLLAVLVGGGAWYVSSRRRGLDEAVTQLRRDAVLRDAQGRVLFDGSLAEVVEEAVEAGGDDASGPWLRVSSLCRMPDGRVWRVVAETARRDREARCTVTLEPAPEPAPEAP